MIEELTLSEQAIYDILVNTGMSSKYIAKTLGYTTRSVEIKIGIILYKKKVTTQKELIVQHYKDIISRGILCPSMTSL